MTRTPLYTLDGWDDLTDDSAVRRVGAEACVLGGAARAILLQVAHPRVGRGVAEHSRFTEDPLSRLRGTLYYVYGLTFGTRDEAEWIAGLVDRRHRAVVGAGYSAADPDLQLWVAATLYDSAARAYEIAFGPMDPATSEELCAQGARMAVALGCPAELWPASVAEFRAYWDREVARLEVGEEARQICRGLMYGKGLPWYLRALLPGSRLVTAGLLPPRLRADFGLRWSPARERLFRLLVRGTRLTYRHVPGPVRRLPMTCSMRDFRKQYRRYA